MAGDLPHLTAGEDQLRLLILAPFAPRLDAPHGGGRSIAQLVIELGARHRVALLCLRPEGDPPTDDFVRARCVLVEEFDLPGIGRNPVERWLRRARLLAALARGRPMWAADCAVGPMAERVREVMGSWHPDVVQAEFHVMGQYLRDARLAGAIAVLTEHEPGTSAANEVARGSCGVARLVLRADAIAWRRFETGMLRHADAVVTYTERDRRFVASLAPGARVVRIPLATRIPPQPLDPIGAEPPSLVFVGNFMHPPNVDAALRLARGILPRIAAREPEVRLYLVGDRVPAAVRRVAAPNVIVTGLVDDVTPYLGRAAVVAVPVRTGGGLRVKVVEALAAGKAIVASRLAVEGLDVAHGEEVLLAEADDEFADAVLALLRDPQRRVAIASKARRWAEENLGWSRTVDDYERLYAELLLESNKRS